MDQEQGKHCSQKKKKKKKKKGIMIIHIIMSLLETFFNTAFWSFFYVSSQNLVCVSVSLSS